MGFIVALAAAAQLAAAVKKASDELDSSHHVVVEVANHTDRALHLKEHRHDFGGFKEPPSVEIPAHSTDVFSTQKKSVAPEGTEGRVLYVLRDTDVSVEIRWDNPVVGSNSGTGKTSGSGASAFEVSAIMGSGHSAKLKVELRAVDMRGHAVYGGILDKWAALQWWRGPLGYPTMSEDWTADRVGRYVKFEKGAIYWRPDVGACGVWGEIYERWALAGTIGFGYPITDEMKTPDGVGRYNHFRRYYDDGRTAEGSIYWSPATKAQVVYGGIRRKWAELGWERGSLGYPVGEEVDHQGGRRQQFQRGALVWTRDGGTRIE